MRRIQSSRGLLECPIGLRSSYFCLALTAHSSEMGAGVLQDRRFSGPMSWIELFKDLADHLTLFKDENSGSLTRNLVATTWKAAIWFSTPPRCSARLECPECQGHRLSNEEVHDHPEYDEARLRFSSFADGPVAVLGNAGSCINARPEYSAAVVRKRRPRDHCNPFERGLYD
jgi:hypothetical protein